jgi:hypothetical protein
MDELLSMPNFLDLGGWTIGQIKPLFNLFTDEKVAPALALVIFSSAIILCILFMAETTYIEYEFDVALQPSKKYRANLILSPLFPPFKRT